MKHIATSSILAHDRGASPPEPLVQDLVRTYHRYLGGLTKAGMDRKVQAGGYPGKAPTGYRNLRVGGEPRIKVDPVIGPLVAEAFHLAAQRRSSVRQVLAELTPKGLVSRNGEPLGPSALVGILRNPFYAGLVRYRGQLYRGVHEALVSRSLFERAGRSLRRRRH